MSEQPLPNLLIIGVHKAATTSLYDYLLRHPEICGGRKKEIHYYTPIRYGRPLEDASVYASYFKHCNGERYRVDASPSYLYSADIAERIAEELPGSKLILVLRNPVQRFVSFYRFLKTTQRLDEDTEFDDFVDHTYKLASAEDLDRVDSRAFREGSYGDYIEPWLERFGDDLRIVFFDEISEDTRGLMLELSSWLAIDDEVYRNEAAFDARNTTQTARNRLLHKAAMNVNRRLETFFNRHSGLKSFIKSAYYKLNGDKKKETINKESLERLDGLYREKNRQLAAILTRDGYSSLPDWLKQA